MVPASEPKVASALAPFITHSLLAVTVLTIGEMKSADP